MRTRSRGVFAVEWAETEIDGWQGAAPGSLVVGASWAWSGREVRLDGPQDVLRLVAPEGDLAELAARAARRVARMPGAGRAVRWPAPEAGDADPPDVEGFTVTDGRREFHLGLVRDRHARRILVVLPEVPPPARTTLWVVARTHAAPGPEGGDAVGFADGTRMLTPDGARPVESLQPGDLVLTRDDGVQPVVAIEAVRLSAARLQVAPWLAPVRVRAGAGLHETGPGELLAAPSQRILLAGPGVAALFRAGEVLARAGDLIDERWMTPVRVPREVVLRTLTFARPQAIWANGIPCASAAPDADALPPVRPHIGKGEAAIVRHALHLAAPAEPVRVPPGARAAWPAAARRHA